MKLSKHSYKIMLYDLSANLSNCFEGGAFASNRRGWSWNIKYCRNSISSQSGTDI